MFFLKKINIEIIMELQEFRLNTIIKDLSSIL